MRPHSAPPAGTVTTPPGTNTNLTFDGCGNRTSLNGVALATPNNMNQPTDAGITYDNEGNLLTYNGWTYTYDAQNRLTNATNGATTAAFYYDGKNRQIARSMNGTFTFSVWDDWELIEEYGTGNVRTSSYLQGAHGPIKSLITNIYFYQDELGSTSHIADATGHLLESYTYNLYGKPTYWDASGNPLTGSNPAYNVRDLFSGERFVPELGLYDLRNRFMSPDLGRFLQPDPVGFKGDGSNLYRYCGNDWANRSDPMGLVDIDVPRAWDVMLWAASQNSRNQSLARRDGNASSQVLQGIRGKDGSISHVSLQNKINIGRPEWEPREEGYRGSGQTHRLIEHEFGLADDGHVVLGKGHVHMNVTGKDTPGFSKGIKSDYAEAAGKSRIIAKTNESDLKSDPNRVTRLTPQTDRSLAPQERVIKPPTAEELKRYDQSSGSNYNNTVPPQASNAEPGSNAADGMGMAFIGPGSKPGPAQ